MNGLSSLYRMLWNSLPLLPATLILLTVSGCKDDETSADLGDKAFLQNIEYGLYVDNARTMVYQKYEHQISRSIDGKAFRLQTDNLSQLVACTFSSGPSSGGSVEVALRTIGIPKIDNGTFLFAVKKMEAGKCWLWNNETQTGIIVPVE